MGNFYDTVESVYCYFLRGARALVRLWTCAREPLRAWPLTSSRPDSLDTQNRITACQVVDNVWLFHFPLSARCTMVRVLSRGAAESDTVLVV